MSAKDVVGHQIIFHFHLTFIDCARQQDKRRREAKKGRRPDKDKATNRI